MDLLWEQMPGNTARERGQERKLVKRDKMATARLSGKMSRSDILGRYELIHPSLSIDYRQVLEVTTTGRLQPKRS